MSRIKESLEDYLQNKNYSTRPYHGTTYPSTNCNIFNSAVNLPKPKSISKQLKTQSKPNTRLYSTSHSYGTGTYYKNVDINKRYVYEKQANPDYYIKEHVTNRNKDRIRSPIHFKYPGTTREEKLTRYYEQYSNNCGDYITEHEQDYYAYDCDQQAEYYTQENKLKNDAVYLPKGTYCYVQPEYSVEASKPSNNSEYYPEYIDHEEKLQNCGFEDKQNKYYCKEIPQKIDNQIKPFLGTIQNDANYYEKSDINGYEPEISTIFERNNVDSTNTCTISSQTSNKSNKVDIRECYSEGTQTLEQDFANIKILVSLGTQTESSKKIESATNTDEIKSLTSNCADTVIRYIVCLFLYYREVVKNIITES